MAACLHAIAAQMRRRTTAQASTCPPTRCFFLSFPVQMLIFRSPWQNHLIASEGIALPFEFLLAEPFFFSERNGSSSEY